MRFKHNEFIDVASVTQRISWPVFGVDATYLPQVTGWAENVAKYDMVEFLSGKLLVYFINAYNSVVNRGGDNVPLGQSNPYFIVGKYVTRNAIDYSGNVVAESPPPAPVSAATLWEQTAEYPGYACKLVGPVQSAKCTQRFKFKMKQRSFKTMKADPSNFQIRTSDIGTTGEFPLNRAGVTIDVCRLGPQPSNTVNLSPFHVLLSYTFMVKFKQKKLVNPV